MKNFLRRIGLFRLLDQLRERYLAIPFIIAGLTLSNTLYAATFPVTNTNDAGPGSLRQAILDVNGAGTGPHNIVFNVYGQITLLTSLPQITKNDLTVDGVNKITLNSNGTNPIINPFDIRANNVTIRNFKLTNNGDIDFFIRANTNGVLIENITTSSTTGDFLNSIVYVQGASTNLTLRKITSTDVEFCGGAYFGRAFNFTGGMQTNLVMDSINLRTLNNGRGCEAIVFRDASVNGWTFTNSNISGFQNAVVLDNTGGPIETANNILLNKITIDSTHSGVALGFFSDFVNTNIQLRNTVIDLDVVTSPDDGDYPIRFDNTTNGITLDSVTVKDGDIYSIWFNGAAQNITINHTTVTDPTPGLGNNGQFLRFESTTSNITIKNTLLDADKTGSTDDADYGLLFIGATNGVTVDSCTVNEFDVDGIYIVAANTNLQIANSKFTGNLDGIELYNSVPRSNVDIINSLFKGNTRNGIVVNAANAVSDIDLTGDTVIENVSHGIWLHGGTAPTDMLINGCVVANNGGAGIRNDDPDKVVYTNNSIYNNTSLGIDNVAGNCGYQNPASVPTIVSSTPMGGGQYELVISLPALAASGYTIDLYANDPATSASSGQYFVTSLTGLNSGSNTRTVTYNTGPGATGAGFWTATLRLPANNCGTSEFSNKLAISTQGPGNVDANVKLWLRADAGLTNLTSVPNTEGQVVNRWSDFSQGGAPNAVTSFGTVTYKKAGINFNPAGYFAGATMQAGGDGSTWLNSANITSIAVFNKYTTAADGSRVYVVYDNASGGYDYTTNAESIIFGRVGANIQTYRSGWENPVIPNAIGKPGLFTSITNAGAHAMYYNGNSQGAAAYNKGNINAEQWFVGGGYAAGWCCATIADIAEVITFDRELTIPELNRVHAYLAIKYGLTLPGNYVASDGTTISWNATANAGYLKHITGIGRDDSTFLYQKQSLSADTGIITLALGNNIAADNPSNAAAIGTNKSFLVFGDNGAAITYTTAASGTYINQRMARVWKVQKTNWTDQNITLRVTGAGSSNYLIISADPSFATISQELPLNSAGTVTISSAMLTDAIYFTIGASIKGPACVTTGIGVWLRADDNGANGAVWGDFSGLGNGAVQTNAVKQATVLPAGVNFNPALKFDGVNDFMAAPSMFTATGTNNIQVYAVAVTDNVQNQDLFGELVSNGQHVHAHLPWSDGIAYWDAPYGYRAQGAWGGTTGAPYLWSFLRSPSSMNAFRNRTQVAVYNAAMSNIAGSNNPFGVGGLANGIQGFNGKIAELIVYNNSSAITATQRQQIESYLALKYGLTLSPAAPVDYLASNGITKIWDATINTGYKWHITGIGRDSCTGLYQKQSLSADTGFVTIALGSGIAASNAANSGSIANNISFFVFGDNGGANTYINAVTGLAGAGIRLGRTWKVQKTNWADQDITLMTDTALTAPQYLIISADATFGAGDLVLPVTNRSITVNTSQFANGSYFTFANAFKGPGNVTTGIAAWWRADVAASSTSWNDYSGNGKTLAQASVANQPSLLPVNVNYQPSMKFGTTGWMLSPSLFGTASTNNIAIFAVSAADGAGANNAGSGLFSEYVSNGERIAAWAPYQDGRIYWYPPLGWSVASTPLISWANPRFNLLGFTKTPAQLNIYFNNATVGTANGAYTGINGNNQPFYLGAYNGPDWFNGRVAEFVVYNNSSAMTATDRQKIQSYLALKYGITLNPAAPVDYLASDGTHMWSATDNAGYQRRITGLGRDDSSALYQRQSLSIDTGIVAIAAGSTFAVSNAANASVISPDKSFLVFGDNGASASYLIPVTGITGVNNRMTRIFKIDKTNWTDQDITLKLNGGNAQTYLLVSGDAIFGAGDAAYVLNADSTVTLNSSILPDGVYFTFATFIKGPNAITKGLNFWLRADDGASSGTAWHDYSGYQHNAAQPVVASQPVTDAKGINFNYSLKFDGGNDFLDINTTRVHPDSATIFVAGSGSGFAAVRDLVGSGAVGSAHGMEFRLSSASGGLQWLENAASVIGVAGVRTYVENRPYLFSGAQNNLANGIKLYQNFGLDVQGTIGLSPSTANLVSIGSRTIAARGLFWQGNISEVIVYDRVLPDAERQLVESYLGLKYGITLNNGTTAYLASDNTIYWTADATYKSRITGIGRDDSTALNTKQSLSADTGFVTLALGAGVPLTNELNTGTITNDKSFFVFADNGLSATNFTISVTGSANNVVRRMARVWKVNKTNWTDQDITLKINPIGIDNHLLISSDPTFATFTQELPVAADGTITLSSALFTATDLYFTFGAPLKSPGGVAGHAMWVRADIGTSTAADNTALQEWSDFSAFNNNPTQATPANQPIFMNNQASNINFNPLVRFDGVNSSMTAASILGTGTYTGAAAFVVNNQTAPTASIIFTEPTAASNHFSLLATWSDNLVYWDAPYVGNRLTYNAGNVVNQSILWSATSNVNLTANRQSIFRNGVNVSNGNGTTQFTGNNSPFLLGRNTTAGIPYNGRMAELVVYTTALTAEQQRRVNTYLALKYGIPMSNGDSSYLATDGSTIWDATANATYKKNIAGIGRDDEEALQQKQSRSINTGFQVTIGLGSIDSTNSTNPNAFTADKSYLIWGDDSTATAFVTAVTGHPTVNYRMTRVWKVQETGAVGNVLIAIPGNVIPSSFSSPSLIVSADATFDGSDTYTPLTLTSINGVDYYTASVDLTNNQYFSFGALVAAPGGVLGEALWVKADAGVAADATNQVEQWLDQSGSGNIVSELRASTTTHTDPITPTSAIVHVPNAINFNPSVDFTGAVSRSLKGNANVDWNATPTTVFGVSVVEGPILGTGGGIFDGLADWTANSATAAGMGLHANAIAYSLDGMGCAPATSTSPTTGVPRAVRGVYTTPGNGLNSILAVNGRTEVAAGTNCANNATTFFEVGGRTAGDATFDNRIFNGKIPEVIVYRSALSPADNNRVESYLAIKYGLTLDQTTATNYVASDASVTWSAATNGIYKSNIAGIGRDDFSALLQKQSRSVNPGVQIAIALGSLDSTNQANANAFTANKSFLIWGDDGASLTFNTTITGNTAANFRMERVWKVQETGTVGMVEVAAPYDGLPNPQQSFLVVSNDAVFDGTDTFIPLYDIMLDGIRYWAAKADFTTGQYFTVASYIKTPGGVGPTTLWVRADKGIINNTDGSAVDTWVDFGNQVNNASQTVAANQPVFGNNAIDNINYNPVVKFNGTSHFMDLDITKLPTGTTPRTIIGVAKPDNVTGARYIVNWGSAANSQGSGLALNTGVGYMVGYNDDMLTANNFWQVNILNELMGTWAGSGGQANLYSKMLSVSAPVNKLWNTGTAAARLGNSYFASNFWSGPISEVIAFDRMLSPNERQRVSTYLAIRNGYTIDQTVPVNYLNTNGTVIWNATANATYKNNIAGIGRDDIEGLNQKQSKSIQSGAIVAIGLGTIATDNLANNNSFVNDTSYLVWGSNSTALAVMNTDLPAVFSTRLAQEWKVSLSNFDNQISAVAMEFDLNGITHGGSAAADFTLLIDTDGDGDFSTGVISEVTATDFAGGKVGFSSITGLVNGSVFTVAFGPKSLQVITKVNLQGAWNGSAMRTDLKTAGVLPATDPYGLGTTPSASPNAAAAQVVDWVLVELRDANDPTTIIDTRAAFVLANGNVVDTGYAQPVRFYNAGTGSYKVAIRHRNHLGVMSLNAVDFSTGIGTVDFTTDTTETYGSFAQKDLGGGVMGLWAGNVNADNTIRNSAKPSDASMIATTVLTHAGNASSDPAYTGINNVYSIYDVNLDGRVYYKALPADHAIITGNVTGHPGNSYMLTSFIIKEQLP